MIKYKPFLIDCSAGIGGVGTAYLKCQIMLKICKTEKYKIDYSKYSQNSLEII